MKRVVCPRCGEDNAPNAKYCHGCGREMPKVQIEEPIADIEQEPTSKNNRKKIAFGSFVGIVAFIITFYGAQSLFSGSSSLNKHMMRVANELNKSLPVMVDSKTRLDNVSVLPGDIFQYNYTLFVKINEADTTTIKKRMEPVILNTVKTSPEMKYQREHKWTLNYYYRNNAGHYLFSISITPDKYE
jgi:hypothetical protein